MEDLKTDGLRGASCSKLSERSHSIDVPASARWNLVDSEAKTPTAFVGHGGNPMEAGTSVPLATVKVPLSTSATRAMRVTSAGGAIKVKKDVTSCLTRPRISVFMSSSARQSAPKKSSPLSTMALEGTPRLAGTRSLVASTSTKASLPAGYGHSPDLKPLARTASAQRLKDLRIFVRARSQAEQDVVENNPAVVAMGSRHSSASSQPESFAVPTLHRASSVGALKISGNGDVLSSSPVLSPTGSIIQSCELSEQVGAGGRRRNLVCKVFGSGSAYSRPSAGGGL